MKLNVKQLASIAKYLYDVSKAILIGCVIAGITKPAMTKAVVLGVVQSILFLGAAVFLEKDAKAESDLVTDADVEQEAEENSETGKGGNEK